MPPADAGNRGGVNTLRTIVAGQFGFEVDGVKIWEIDFGWQINRVLPATIGCYRQVLGVGGAFVISNKRSSG